ncbi:DUF1614 domain-containing protein [Thalassomonas haliotis]|uniref:DUF1614 domain-containing protein n=1 Tax=Thalassomonas haliotis TaxID=485448 RepID=A0ABY7VBG6_9GAMM|nr:DUF1614 domain-containing protein [Thalassomonas haliotis]WDE10227.1 DUF1614 domain-containing protein [Thalassomonas haliotis]
MPAGIFALVCFFLLLVLWPLIFMDIMLLALAKLGIPPFYGLFIILAIVGGSFINIPLKRYRFREEVKSNWLKLYGLEHRFLPLRLKQNEMVIAVNVGGCLVPLLLALYQLARLSMTGGLLMATAAIMINVVICYRLSKVKPGVGILLPAFYPGIIAGLCGLLFYPQNPSAVAFCSGILGPLIGADLFNLKQIVQLRAGIASIGGAGTFDGIVISGFIALLLT